MAKITGIIHHNQLLLIKLGRILQHRTDDVNRAAKLPDYWTVNREDLGTRLGCLRGEYKNGGTFHLFHEHEMGELWAKNITKTAGRQLDG